MDLEPIKALAGDVVFKRGEGLWQSGSAVIDNRTAQGKTRTIKALVQGQQRYHVQLKINGGELAGASCSCPAFNYQSLCKHCVAVVLEDVNGPADSVPVAKLVKPAKPTKRDRERSQLQGYFEQRSHDDLVSTLLVLLSNDKEAWKDWAFKAEMADKDFTKPELKKLLTKAFPKKHCWEYHKVAQYFDQTAKVLDVFCEQLNQLEAEPALALLVAAYDRLNLVLSAGVDDSGGFRFPVEDMLEASLVRHFQRMTWNDNQCSEWLLQQLHARRDVFPNVPDAFELTQTQREAFLKRL